ncbi:hypothetical protein J2X36_002161 [Methylobacterium sp. BE186]|nr:hypothetical protein [Methylobacterium sp. BE186]
MPACGDTWEETATFDSKETAEARINELRCNQECYLVELWQHDGCYHAVG